MADINLSIGTRQNLLELSRTDKLLRETNERLASGKDVNEAIDNPVNFFASINLEDRSTALNARLDGIGQAIQTLKAAEAGINAIRNILANMEALLNQARDETDISSRRSLGKQFNQLMEQAQELAKDSRYQGTNLLQNNETLTVQFAERFDQSLLRMDGINIEGPGIDGTGKRNDAEEVPTSAVVGRENIASQAARASFGATASIASEASRASSAAFSSAGSVASVASVASFSSIASVSGIASQGSVSAVPANGSNPSRAAVASAGSITGQASKASQASRPSLASSASAGSVQSVTTKASIASRSAVASMGSMAAIAAQSIVQQYGMTLNASPDDRGTNSVLGIQSHGTNSTATGEHEVDWGAHNFRDSLIKVAIQIQKFDNALNVELSNIATNMSVLTVREEFTDELRTTLDEGADKLVLADMNEEGANLRALETRQQLGIQALSLSSDQSQQILRLLQ